LRKSSLNSRYWSTSKLLGLQWTDLDKNRLNIGRSLSQVEQRVFLKEPKNKKFRVITIPPSALKRLKAHRKVQEEYRAHFGASYQGDFIFCNPDGSPLKPDTVSVAVSLRFCNLGLPKGVIPHAVPYPRLAPAGGRRTTDRREQAHGPRKSAPHSDRLCSRITGP
jgi:integrase